MGPLKGIYYIIIICYVRLSVCVCVCVCVRVCAHAPIRFHGIQVQSAALDEMFHCSAASIQRYHKGLLLMEGLSRVVTEQRDAESVDKCKCFIFQR